LPGYPCWCPHRPAVPPKILHEISQLPAAKRIKDELELWKPPTAITDDARNTSEAMRHAALLFYHKLTTMYKMEDDRVKIEKSCQEIIQHIDHVSIDSPAAASHLWPLYMAGFFLNVDQSANNSGQDFVLFRLTALKSKRGLRTVDRVRDRLNHIWTSGHTQSTELDLPLILV
jgi:hypothetical protein